MEILDMPPSYKAQIETIKKQQGEIRQLWEIVNACMEGRPTHARKMMGMLKEQATTVNKVQSALTKIANSERNDED